MTVPTVDRPVRNIESVDRNGHMLPRNTSVGLDIHVDGSDRWFGEAKSGGRVTAAQVRALAEKARFFAQVDKLPAKILWFVSSSGYDQKAQDFACEHGVYFSRASDLKQIDRLLGKHRTIAKAPAHRPR